METVDLEDSVCVKIFDHILFFNNNDNYKLLFSFFWLFSLEQLFTLDGQMLMLVCSFDINIMEARVLNDVTSIFLIFN